MSTMVNELAPASFEIIDGKELGATAELAMDVDQRRHPFPHHGPDSVPAIRQLCSDLSGTVRL